MSANLLVIGALLVCCAVSNMHSRVINDLVHPSEVRSPIREFQDLLMKDFQRISSGLPLEEADKFSLAYQLRETEEYEDLASAFRDLSQESQQEFISYMSQNMLYESEEYEDYKAPHDKLKEYLTTVCLPQELCPKLQAILYSN